MKNVLFQDEDVDENDLFFMCYMIERVARSMHQSKKYVVEKIGREELIRLICLASVLHCENPEKIAAEWIEEYDIREGMVDVLDVDSALVDYIPTETQMAKVYQRLMVATMHERENYIDALMRVYNNELCVLLDDYNCGAFYEPSYFIARAYNNGGF